MLRKGIPFVLTILMQQQLYEEERCSMGFFSVYRRYCASEKIFGKEKEPSTKS